MTSTVEQIARDIREGTFPQKSDSTLREEAVSKIVFAAATETLATAAPTTSHEAIARSLAIKLSGKLLPK